MWYPTCYPQVSNSLEKKSRTILISVTLFFLLIPCSHKVRGSVGSSIKYVRWMGGGGGGVDQLKAYWLVLKGGRVGLSCKSTCAIIFFSRICCKIEIKKVS